MGKSILEKDQSKCFICGCPNTEYNPLAPHHVFPGCRRQTCDKYQLTVTLCFRCHRKVHDDGNQKYMKTLQEYAQREAMKYYGWSIQDFREKFGKNFLEDKDD